MTEPNKRASIPMPSRRSGRDSEPQSQEQVINEAPLQTAQIEQTNPPVDNVKPWRSSTSMSEDELMVMTEKGSYNIPLELILRIDYLVGTKKSRGLGRKTNKTALIIEALDEYTTKELKKQGLSVK